MTPMTRRDRRLYNTYVAMEKLAARCTKREGQPRFEFTHNGDIEAGEHPDMYGVTLRLKGIESHNPLKWRYEHSCTIYLPAVYPAEPPLIKWHTRIFHPNILMFDETSESYQELRRELGSEELLTQHINQNPQFVGALDGYVCLDTLSKNWTPSVGLGDLVIEIANMVRYQTYSANDPYNKAAAEWAKEKEKLHRYFPLDKGLLEIEEDGSIRIVAIVDAGGAYP
jgi:ubiquitin-protein ligase